MGRKVGEPRLTAGEKRAKTYSLKDVWFYVNCVNEVKCTSYDVVATYTRATLDRKLKACEEFFANLRRGDVSHVKQPHILRGNPDVLMKHGIDLDIVARVECCEPAMSAVGPTISSSSISTIEQPPESDSPAVHECGHGKLPSTIVDDDVVVSNIGDTQGVTMLEDATSVETDPDEDALPAEDDVEPRSDSRIDDDHIDNEAAFPILRAEDESEFPAGPGVGDTEPAFPSLGAAGDDGDAMIELDDVCDADTPSSMTFRKLFATWVVLCDIPREHITVFLKMRDRFKTSLQADEKLPLTWKTLLKTPELKAFRETVKMKALEHGTYVHYGLLNGILGDSPGNKPSRKGASFSPTCLFIICEHTMSFMHDLLTVCRRNRLLRTRHLSPRGLHCATAVLQP